MMVTEYTKGLYSVQTDLNIPVLKKTCHDMYRIVKRNFEVSDNAYTGQVALSNRIFWKYNFLLYTLPGIHELFVSIRDSFFMLHKLHYGDNPPKEPYYIQSWLNFYFKGDFIDWHHHDWNMNRPLHFDPAWHGFVCVDTEPDSKTSYRWKNLPHTIEVPSKDGLLVLGLSNGDVHKSSEWLDDTRPRITIAFDIVPRRNLFNASNLPRSNHSFEDHSDELVRRLCNFPQDHGIFFNHWIPI